MIKKNKTNKKIPFKVNDIIASFKSKSEELKSFFIDGEQSLEKALIYQSKYSELIDKIIKKFADEALLNEKLTIIALGGYGRKELAPYSDIDLLFLYDNKLQRTAEKFITTLTTSFWDMGLKLSASTRSINQCEKDMSEDIFFLTSLLEKRFICGDKNLFKKIEKNFRTYIKLSSPSVFIENKLSEVETRHQKMGNSRYFLEPNIKEGKGALRDIHTLLWISNFLYNTRKAKDLLDKGILNIDEAEMLERALSFFSAIRCHLHFLSGRAEDRLSFEVQPIIAKHMGYKNPKPNKRAERFMKDYFLRAREVGYLTRIICAKLEEEHSTGLGTSTFKKLILYKSVGDFPVKNNRLTVENATFLKKDPSKILSLFQMFQETGIDIHPDALRIIDRLIRSKKLQKELRSEESYQIFLNILCSPKAAEQTLRMMNEASVLEALIPAFSNIVAHMQYDMYHVYTADAHTIRAVGFMHRLESGALKDEAPFVTSLFPKIHFHRVLYIAIFLHDIAKGLGDHAEEGAKIALDLAPKFDLSADETEMLSWLVKDHLLMTMTAFKRDLNDPKTTEDFVGSVQSLERLKLLTILTAADIMAVGPQRWNSWKAGLLKELYERAFDWISGTEQSFLDKDLFISQYLKPAEIEKKNLIKITLRKKEAHTEVVIFTADRRGLFATLSGALAASGASIVNARIFTLTDGRALDVFQIQNLNGEVYDNTVFLRKTIKSALEGKINLKEEIAARRKNLPKKEKLFKVTPSVVMNNTASTHSTMIEVTAKDRPGFLFEVSSFLSEEGLQISSAKVTTFGSRAVDVFYVRDLFGLKIFHANKLDSMKNKLKHLLETSA